MAHSADAMDEPIPVNASLSALYPIDALQFEEQRWKTLVGKFASEFGHNPAFVARSPGRVNIIGEHIDYSLYDCLPAGIAADVVIAVSTSKPNGSNASIDIANVNPEKFKPQTFTLDAHHTVAIDSSTHEWTNYFKAGAVGALALLAKPRPDFVPLSMQVLIDGTVPAGGGLSSSAAFVCASALAVIYGNGVHAVTKRSLVELAIVSERSVGVNSGGMDQTGSVCSKSGNALHVSFFPDLSAKAISFPELDPPITFMIAQSYVTSDKHVTGPVCYNLRVVEVTLAAEYIAAQIGLTLPKDASSLEQSLRGLEEAYFGSHHAPKDGENDQPARLQHMLSLVERYLPDTAGYDRQQIADALKISVSELESRYMTKFPIRADRFLLRQRALHVYSEALRVHQFISLIQAPAPQTQADSEILLKKLGGLMNETQDSCKEVFECSCPELNDICQIARKHGSYGSRLTGAGWGGCSVHLVPGDKTDDIRKAWEQEYYAKKFPDLSQEKLEEAVVVSQPGEGAMM
ncbi:MAG: hypothetical protein LQ340_007075 [Diploschistes diacapsis]|nr:MAG: hypothetical protein LQ340_007075 [Diploschistes diacapsis]